MGRQQAIHIGEGWFKVQYKLRSKNKQRWRAGQSRRHSRHLSATTQQHKGARYTNSQNHPGIGTNTHHFSSSGNYHLQGYPRLHQQKHSTCTQIQPLWLKASAIATKTAVERLFVYGPVNPSINGYPRPISSTKIQHLQRHLPQHSSAITSKIKPTFIAMSKKRNSTTPQPPNSMQKPPSPLTHSSNQRQPFKPTTI